MAQTVCPTSNAKPVPVSLSEIEEGAALLKGSEPERVIVSGSAGVVRSSDGWRYWFREVPMDGNRVKVCEAFGPFTI